MKALQNKAFLENQLSDLIYAEWNVWDVYETHVSQLQQFTAGVQ